MYGVLDVGVRHLFTQRLNMLYRIATFTFLPLIPRRSSRLIKTCLFYLGISTIIILFITLNSNRLSHNSDKEAILTITDNNIPIPTVVIENPTPSTQLGNLTKKWLDQLSQLRLLHQPVSFPVFDGPRLKGHPPLVTSVSSNHYDELLGYIENLQTVFHNYTLFVYDLGLLASQRDFLLSVYGVKLRMFNFSNYPNYVGRLHEFRWKALVIAEAALELDVFWYTDPSVNWKHSDLSADVYSKFTCGADGGCSRSPFTLMGWGGFMLQLTDPGMYKFLPADKTALQNETMYSATFMFFVRARESLTALTSLVLCSLEKDCMSPPGARVGGCRLKFSYPYINEFSGCHRFDQSAINLILFEQNKHNTTRYFLQDGKLVDINRGRSSSSLNAIRLKQ